ncbi:MAG: hypothetical protein JJ863_19270 [Deltaproteobacteria bacterium]|nr:hypothetical protein [Deltaproteobacteria bacterium]
MRPLFATALLLLAGPWSTALAQTDEAEPAATEAAEPEADSTDSPPAEAEPEPEPEATEPEPTATEPEEPEPEADGPQGGDELPPEMRQVVDDTEPTRAPREAPPQFMRLVGRLGVGGALRLVSHDELQQDRLAPSYLNLQGALVLPLSGTFRHSVLVGASSNLESDGSFVSGVDPFEQWVIEVGYGLHVPFGRTGAPTWLVGGHVSGALVVSPDLTWGFEVGGDAAYHFLAGLGVYAELNVGTYFGAEDRFGNLTVNPLLALEIGLTWDYEVLP